MKKEKRIGDRVRDEKKKSEEERSRKDNSTKVVKIFISEL
jgi:hypothetical protein